MTEIRAVNPGESKSPPPKAPTGLRAAGKRLWQSVAEGFELREDERMSLENACRTADELARIDKALREGEVVVTGSQGQPRPNPLLSEARAHRLALRQLLAAVGLTDDDAQQQLDGFQRSAAGRKLAKTRWGRGAA